MLFIISSLRSVRTRYRDVADILINLSAHPCNMKELKVLVGATTEHMTEILHSGLKNDNIPETFVLNHVNASGVTFPTRYVKVVPLL